MSAMNLAELPREAVQALRANRLRSFLTLLGMIIGVSTLVGVVSVISDSQVKVTIPAGIPQ